MQLELEPPFTIILSASPEEEFYRLASEDSNWEYLDGRIVMHSPASYRHEDLQGFLFTLTRGYADETGAGAVLGSRYPMRLDPRWSPEPDLLFVRKSRKHLLVQQRLEGPADLVVEIVSATDSLLVYKEKVPRYRDAGLPEVWIVDPFRKEVLVDAAGPSARVTRSLRSGRLASAVLAGFWIEVDWLWEEKLPSTLACLRQLLAERPA
jgi:Uma2 family endonuclease